MEGERSGKAEQIIKKKKKFRPLVHTFLNTHLLRNAEVKVLNW